MNNLNSILVEGNLVKAPEVKHTPKGTAICTFTIASNRYIKEGDEFEKEVSFFDIEAFGKEAEACYQKGKKGKGVRVDGRLKQYRWECKDGKVHSRIAIIAEHVEFRPEFKKQPVDEVLEETKDE